jgi:ATP-dependent RNA helicase DeaD
METRDKPTFAGLGLSPAILKAVEALGFEEAAPIQAAAIPVMLAGHDMVGQSQTGSGKTAAFAIPAIEKVDVASKAVQVLILCPTRELAIQVAEEVHKLAAFSKGVSAVPIYGGASYDRQFFELRKGVQIVIGTPGRVLDHIERKTLALDKVRMVVLDEADRMLDMGFRDDIGRILDVTPSERQTVFFSATISPAIRDLIKRYSREPRTIRIEQKSVTVPTVEQWFYEVPYNRKVEALLRLVDYHGFKLGIIFCNTQRMVDELTDTLLAQGFSADRLHGGIPQAQRTRVMNKFKQSEFEFLVATDVAARGIDVDDLEVVVNFDLPYDAEDYVHRIGRTGRAGKRGMAMTFVSGRDIYKLSFFERFTRTRIHRGRMPTVNDVEEKKSDALLKKMRTVLGGDSFKSQTPLVDRLLEEGFLSTDIAAAVFHILTGAGGDSSPSRESAPVPPPRTAVPAVQAAPAEANRPVRPPPPRAVAPAAHAPPAEASRPARTPARATAPAAPHVQAAEASRPVRTPPARAAAPAAHVPPAEVARPARTLPPPAIRPRQQDAKPVSPAGEEPVPVLRLVPEGSLWVRLSIGWRDKITPKTIVSLLGKELDVPAPRVGMIHLTETQSFAQVRKQYLYKLFKGPVSVDAEFGPVQLSLLPEKRPVKSRQKPTEPRKKGPR